VYVSYRGPIVDVNVKLHTFLTLELDNFVTLMQTFCSKNVFHLCFGEER
jgi:hypothetical protein